MVAADQNPCFDHPRPSVAHISYDSVPWARRITKWARNVAIGKNDRAQTLTKAEFINGGTVGPPAS